MEYSALYRRFRPDTFAQIIGQPHITTILQNQIRNGRVAHAYLFCGSRGTGKTSSARIFAKAINCLNSRDGEPCGVCSACAEDSGVDIIEIDAASNSRVEEMRSLIERAEFAPLRLKTKVYIIDEAHMLTKNASNALLKTLEEPPKHVVFILATTEPQMLPATIVSRCQRFEFHRLSVSDMVNTMRGIISKTGAHIDEAGLADIARAAAGSLRDCLSIADQCLSYCGNNVTADDVLSVLGSVNSRFLFKIADSIIDSDYAGIMRYISEVAESGRDMGVFTIDLAAHFRAILLTKICDGNCQSILDCTNDMLKDYGEQAKRISKERAERALEELLKLQLNLRLVSAPRTLVESALLRICRPEDSDTIVALADRVHELENAIKNAPKSVKAAPQSEVIEVKETPVAAVKLNETDVPDATPDGDVLYQRLLDCLDSPDFERTLCIAISTSQAHWVEDDVLHICFDKYNSHLYNYANEADMRSILRDAARNSIAPYTVELDLRQGRVRQSKIKNEIMGVPIVKE